MKPRILSWPAILCAVIIVLACTAQSLHAITWITGTENPSGNTITITDDGYFVEPRMGNLYTNNGTINTVGSDSFLAYFKFANFGAVLNSGNVRIGEEGFDEKTWNRGWIVNDTGGIFHIKNNAILYNENGGTFANNPGGSVIISGELDNDSVSNMSNQGSLRIGTSGKLFNHGSLHNHSGAVMEISGVLLNYSGAEMTNWEGGTVDWKNGDSIISGTFNNHGSLVNSNQLTIGSSGTFRLGSAGTYSGSGSVILSGFLENHSASETSITGLEFDGGTLWQAATAGKLYIGDMTVNNGDGTITGEAGAKDISVTVLEIHAQTLTNNLGLGSSLNIGTLTGNGLIQGTGHISLATVNLQSYEEILTISNVISGTGSLTKTGPGTLTLSGANTYSGGTTVNAGTLALSGSGTLGATTATTAITGGILDLGTTTQTQAALSQSGGTVQNGTMNVGTYQLTGGSLSSNATVSASSSFDMQTGAVNGILSGAGALTKTGAGAVTLTGANTYSGGTTVNEGTFALSGSGTLGATTATTAITGGILDLGTTTQTQAALSQSGGTVQNGTMNVGTYQVTGGTLSSNATVSASSSFDMQTGTVNGILSGAGALTKTGAGTVTLAGANTYSGGTTVNAGTLALSGSGTLGATTATAAITGGILDLGMTTQTQAALSQSGGTVQNGTMNVTTCQVTGGTLSSNATVSASSSFDMQTGTVNGILSGAGALTKTGAGAVTLTGANTYSGGTTVNEGTFALSGSGTLGATTATATITGGILDLGATTQTQSTLNHSGGTVQNGTMNVGTYQLTGGTLSSNATVSASSSFDMQTGTVNGILAGAGTLTKSGPGTVTLTGANTYTGGTVVNAGTVSASDAGSLGDASGTLTIGGGTVQAANSFTTGRAVTINAGGGAFDTNGNSLTLSGIISGTGLLTKTGSGTLILTGANNYSGGTTVSNGTLQGDASSLQGNITDNANVTFNQASTGTYAGAISGTGSLTKEGTGRLILSGANSYTGATTINTGTLSVNGSITSPVTINGAGILGGSGMITGNATNGGSLAPGNSIGTLTIAGNYTHNAGATYQVEVNSASQSDKLIVTGTATLNGGTVSVLAESGVYKMSTNYTILTAGSVAGTFANVTSNLAFLTPSLSYDPANVYLLLTRNITGFADVAANPNQYAVASGIDRTVPTARGDMSEIINNLLGLSAPGARSAFDRMGGLSHISLTEAASFSMNRYINTLSGRMGGFGTGDTALSDAGNILLAFNENSGSDAGNMLLVAINSTGEKGGMRENGTDVLPRGLWAKGYGSIGERRGDEIAARYDYRGGSLIVGFDRKVSKRLLLGAAAGYSYTKVNMNSLNDDGRVASYRGSIYGAYNLDPWYVNGLIAYGYNRYNTTRNIVFGSIARSAHADYGGHGLSGYVETGWQIKTGVVNIIPMASLQAGSLWRNAFTESDAGALDLSADSDRMSSLIGSLGVKLGKKYKTKIGSIAPEIRVRWLHEFVNSDYTLNASFADDPVSAFSVNGGRARRDSAAVGFGLSWEIDRSLGFALTYDAVLSGDRTEHGGTAGIRYRW